MSPVQTPKEPGREILDVLWQFGNNQWSVYFGWESYRSLPVMLTFMNPLHCLLFSVENLLCVVNRNTLIYSVCNNLQSIKVFWTLDKTKIMFS